MRDYKHKDQIRYYFHRNLRSLLEWADNFKIIPVRSLRVQYVCNNQKRYNLHMGKVLSWNDIMLPRVKKKQQKRRLKSLNFLYGVSILFSAERDLFETFYGTFLYLRVLNNLKVLNYSQLIETNENSLDVSFLRLMRTV